MGISEEGVVRSADKDIGERIEFVLDLLNSMEITKAQTIQLLAASLCEVISESGLEGARVVFPSVEVVIVPLRTEAFSDEIH